MKKFFIPSALVALSLIVLAVKKIHAPAAALALTLLSVPSVQAAYNPGIVGADARWVVYADLNALRESAVGKELMAAISKAQTEATGGTIGLDIPRLLTTVGSLTAYGSNLVADPALLDGTLIAQGTADLRKIAESVLLQGTIAQAETFSEVTDLPFPAYAIGDPKAPPGRQMKLMIAFPPEPIVIVSKSKAQVLKAREVFRGREASLAKSNGNAIAKLANVAEGAYLFAATEVPKDPVFPENSTEGRLLQLAKSGGIALGERGTDTFARADLFASSTANAERMSKILQGLVAVLSFAETNNKALGDFLQATSVTQEKERVTLNLAYSSVRLAQMVHALQLQVEGKPRVVPPQPITIGKTLAEWGGDENAAAPSKEVDADGVALRTVENVSLVYGSRITLGRVTNGATMAKIERVEIRPAGGSGMGLIYRQGQDGVRSVGGNGNMWQISFPGEAGVYTLKVAYRNEPADSKAKFAVSLAEPIVSARGSSSTPSKSK